MTEQVSSAQAANADDSSTPTEAIPTRAEQSADEPTVALAAPDAGAALEPDAAPDPVAAPEASEGPEEPEASEGEQPEAAEAPRRSRFRLVALVSLGAAAVLVALGAFAAVQLVSDGVVKAKVGDCISGAASPQEGQEAAAEDAELVDCGSGKAAFKVVARFENKRVSEADAACQPYPNAPFVFTAIPDDGTGFVLCLAKV